MSCRVRTLQVSDALVANVYKTASDELGLSIHVTVQYVVYDSTRGRWSGDVGTGCDAAASPAPSQSNQQHKFRTLRAFDSRLVLQSTVTDPSRLDTVTDSVSTSSIRGQVWQTLAGFVHILSILTAACVTNDTYVVFELFQLWYL